MYEHNTLDYWSGLALCLTKVRSSRARCPATALIVQAQASSFYICKFSKFKSSCVAVNLPVKKKVK